MPLDTSPAASEGRSYATLAGRDSTALNVSGLAHYSNIVIQATCSERPHMRVLVDWVRVWMEGQHRITCRRC